MNLNDLVGKTVKSVTYPFEGPNVSHLTIEFMDGTVLEADDGHSYGCVVSINGEQVDEFPERDGSAEAV